VSSARFEKSVRWTMIASMPDVVKIAANPAASQCATPGMKICGTASVPTIPRKPKMNVAA
jgi:hypothetical protein